jgi:hypothetical protein
VAAVIGLVASFAVLRSFFSAGRARFVDRYFLPLSVPVLVLALRHVRLGAPALVTAAVVAMLAVVIVVHDSALRGALWKVGEQAVAQGASVREVDAGIAWVGYHRAEVPLDPGCHQGRVWLYRHVGARCGVRGRLRA